MQKRELFRKFPFSPLRLSAEPQGLSEELGKTFFPACVFFLTGAADCAKISLHKKPP